MSLIVFLHGLIMLAIFYGSQWSLNQGIRNHICISNDERFVVMSEMTSSITLLMTTQIIAIAKTSKRHL